MSRVEDEVRRKMGKMDCPGLVAVSGGSDSVALLHALVATCLMPITVVHVNHKLRGEESDEDEAFVIELADTFGVPISLNSLPIPEGTNIESTARDLRYAWFRDLAVANNCGWIATGHTADDQVETVLHRIIRGTGLVGLVGMGDQRAVGFNPTVLLLRPLLNLRRQELVEYLHNLNQPFRTDSSNANPQFTRNRIRNEVLPLLREINPRVDEALLRLARQANEREAWISSQVTALLSKAVKPPAGDVYILDAEPLEQAESLLVREMFRTVWQSLGWPMGEMSAEHWERLAKGDTGDYPGGISVRRVGKVVQLLRKP